MTINKFSVPAYWPRSDSRSVLYPNAALDVVYEVHGQPESSSAGRKMNILFLHGGQYSKESFRYIIELCEREYGPSLNKCISVDHVVCGDSAVLNEGKASSFLVWEDMARDAAVVVRDCLRRQEISIDEPLIVFGHSMGGAAAVALSVFEPALVAGLVLIDPTWGGDVDLSDIGLFNMLTAKLARAAYRNAIVDFPDLAAYREYMNTKYLSHVAHPRVRDDMTASSYVQRPDGTVRMKVPKALQGGPYMSASSMVGFGQSLANRVRMPTLLIHGDIYDFNPEGLTESLETHIRESGNPNVSRIVIPGTAHVVCHTHPDETFAACKDFMRETANKFHETRQQAAEQHGRTPDEQFHRDLAAALGTAKL